jgi:flagellar hook assembly protein FlgD
LQLQIYDLAGRVVKSLPVPNPQSPITKVIWDGKDNLGEKASPGVYFVKLKVGEFSQTKKLLFLK